MNTREQKERDQSVFMVGLGMPMVVLYPTSSQKKFYAWEINMALRQGEQIVGARDFVPQAYVSRDIEKLLAAQIVNLPKSGPPYSLNIEPESIANPQLRTRILSLIADKRAQDQTRVYLEIVEDRGNILDIPGTVEGLDEFARAGVVVGLDDILHGEHTLERLPELLALPVGYLKVPTPWEEMHLVDDVLDLVRGVGVGKTVVFEQVETKEQQRALQVACHPYQQFIPLYVQGTVYGRPMTIFEVPLASLGLSYGKP